MTENELDTCDSDNGQESYESEVEFKASKANHSPIFHPQPVPQNLKHFSMKTFLLLGFFCKLLQDVIAALIKFRYLIPDQVEDSPIGLY